MSKWRTIGTINGDTPCEVKTSTAHIMRVQRMQPVAYEDLQKEVDAVNKAWEEKQAKKKARRKAVAAARA